MGIENVLGVALKPIGKIFKLAMGGGSESTPSASADTSKNTAADDAAANQGRLNPLIFTSQQGVLDPANPGKKLLLGN